MTTTKWRLLSAGVVLCIAGLLLGADAPQKEKTEKIPHPLDGSWRWNFTMPDGTTARPKLQLSVENGKVTGVTSFRSETENHITNALLNGDQLRFQVIRVRDGQPIITTYSGRWDTNKIVGTIESDWSGQKQSYPWEALRGHHGVEGTWRWTVRFGRG